MAELILCCCLTKIAQDGFPCQKKKKNLNLNMVITDIDVAQTSLGSQLTDLSSESFTFSREINSLPHCFLYCGMTFLLPHFKNKGKTSSQIFLLHWRWTVSSYFTDHFLQRCLVLLSSLTKKDIIYKYMTAMVTRSVLRAPQVTGLR